VTTVAPLMIMVFGLFLVGVSCLMLANPPTAIRFLDQFASTTFINLLEATLLIIFGAAFIWYAEFSKFPNTLWVFGLLLIVPGVGIYLVPREWHRRYGVWSTKLVTPYLRLLAPLSLLFGVLLIYAVV